MIDGVDEKGMGGRERAVGSRTRFDLLVAGLLKRVVSANSGSRRVNHG